MCQVSLLVNNKISNNNNSNNIISNNSNYRTNSSNSLVKVDGQVLNRTWVGVWVAMDRFPTPDLPV